MTDTFNHAGLKALAKKLGRELFTLEVLRNDPFTADAPAASNQTVQAVVKRHLIRSARSCFSSPN
jgi:hypothetical protein